MSVDKPDLSLEEIKDLGKKVSIPDDLYPLRAVEGKGHYFFKHEDKIYLLLMEERGELVGDREIMVVASDDTLYDQKELSARLLVEGYDYFFITTAITHYFLQNEERRDGGGPLRRVSRAIHGLIEEAMNQCDQTPEK